MTSRRARAALRSAAAAMAAALVAAAGAAAHGTHPDKIPEGTAAGQGPAFLGSPATPRAVRGLHVPRHPFMAPNDKSVLHNDAYQSDTYRIGGPLGRHMRTKSDTQPLRECASITFDRRGRLVTICVGFVQPAIVLFSPNLHQLATMDLPPREPGGANPFTDFSGGGYFYLDNRDRAVVPTGNRHIFVIRQTGAPGFQVERDYDLTSAVPIGDKIISALPDWSGRIWFASTKGVVGTVDPDSGNVQSVDLEEPNGNSFAVDETGGVFIVTDAALYRFDAGQGGAPEVTWRRRYPNIGEIKPGQTQAGSGTTPTLMGNGLVAITDNADPMAIVVYRRGRGSDGGDRVCRQPVFEKGRSATDQSLISNGRSMIVENNHGYTGPTSTTQGRVTSPGIERVDLDRDGRGCHLVWHSDERAPSVVPKLSLGNGLVYTYTKDPEPDDEDAWYLTALDFRTGRTVYRRLAGGGLGYNNNFAPVTIGPTGNLYLGVLGGIVMFRDREPPPTAQPPPRLSLALGYARGETPGGRECARENVLASVGGTDVRLVDRVEFELDGRPLGTDSGRPFERRISRAELGAGGVHDVTATAILGDGRRRTLSDSVRACPEPDASVDPDFTG